MLPPAYPETANKSRAGNSYVLRKDRTSEGEGEVRQRKAPRSMEILLLLPFLSQIFVNS